MRVMVFGTFDNLHPGHLNYFWQARNFAIDLANDKNPELIVVVARDQNVLKIKGHLPQQSEKYRANKVRGVFKTAAWSGKATLGSLTDKWAVLRKYQPDFIGLGYDQKVDIKQLKKVLAEAGLFCIVKRLKSYYPTKYKSSYCRAD